MAEVFDIMIDDEFDLLVESGDFVTDESTIQHHKCLLVANKGNYLQNPGVGVGLFENINNDENTDSIKKEIQRVFEADGMTIVSITIKDDDITVKANY